MLSVRDAAAAEKSLTLVAGAQGLGARISRTHMVESLEIARMFAAESELIFTTGAGLEGDALPELVRAAQSRGASGIVVNIGPYIKEIDRAALEFAGEAGFPLFTCPWEVRMAEIMHRISCRVEENGGAESRAVPALKNAMLRGDAHGLRKLGLEDARFYVALLSPQAGASQDAYRFELEGREAAVFVGAGREELRRRISGGFAAVGAECAAVGLAKAYSGVKKLYALFSLEDAPRFMDESGAWQLLLNIEDRAALESFCDNVLGKLLRCDAKKKGGLADTLETYIECGCSLKEASAKLGVHKNTVTNKVRRCGEILGADIAKPSVRRDVELALLARRVLALPE